MTIWNKRVVIIPIILCLSAVLFAQGLPVVAAYSLSSSSANDTVTRTVNDLVFSFIRELRTYRMLDMRTEALPADLGIPEGSSYIFYGTLQEQPDGLRLELVLKGGPYTVTRIISRVYENSNRILLESRMLVRDLFDQSVALPDPGTEQVPQIAAINGSAVNTQNQSEYIPVRSVDALAGTWHGEEEIEKIMILRGGRAIVILKTGLSLTLEMTIGADDLVVRQKGTILPRQFADVPDPVAKQAADIAPPLEWHFLVSRDQKTLSGTKKTVTIKHDGQNVLSMESVELKVLWSRD
jgi:hypothetical protein